MITSADMFQLLLDMLQASGIHYVTMDDGHANSSDIDQGFRARIQLHAWYDRFTSHLAYATPGTLALYQDELDMFYSIFALPEGLAAERGCKYLVIGPILFGAPTEQSVATVMEGVGADSAYRQHFIEFFNQAFVSPSMQGWITTLLFYLRRICGDTPVNFVQVMNQEDGFVADADYRIPKDPDIALAMIEARYRAENAMMDAIAAGNYDEALDRLRVFLGYRLSPRQADPVRNKKNIQFVFNTLMRKAAERGGVHPVHIDNLSHQLALDIENATSVEQLDQLLVIMIRKYCLLVQNYARNDYPALVQNCINAIDFYYNSDLSLARLARICNVSESHLSSAFRKATGTTVTEYINQTRVHQALLLLNSTSLPIGEIASRCGFYDANYFSRIFRKAQGMSPRQYRETIRG